MPAEITEAPGDREPSRVLHAAIIAAHRVEAPESDHAWPRPTGQARLRACLAVFLCSLLMLTAWAVMFTWVYNSTSGSLFLTVLLHAVAYITGSMVQPGNWIGSALLLILTWATVTLVVVRAGAARLSRSSSMAPAEDGDSHLTTVLQSPPARQLSRHKLGITDPS
jgi:hypothetical protein